MFCRGRPHGHAERDDHVRVNVDYSCRRKWYMTTKVLVNEWNIADDPSDVLAFARSGKLIFRKDGKLNTDDIAQLIKVIKENL